MLLRKMMISDSQSQAAHQKPEIDLVCFDLGRVLIRICDNWQHACRVAGVPVPEYPLAAAERAQLHQKVAEYESGRLDVQGFSTCASSHLKLTPEQMAAASAAYLMEPFAGAVELLDELHQRRIRTACLSNTIDTHWQMVLNESGPFYSLMSRLQHRFASHLLGARKPDARVYEHVERETGTPGERIVFFDDMIENVEAARARGWQAELISREPHPIEQVRGHLVRMKIL